MHQRKSRRVIFFIFLLILVGSINNIKLRNFKIGELKSIKITGLTDVDNKIILQKIREIDLKNIFSINEREINRVLESNTLH